MNSTNIRASRHYERGEAAYGKILTYGKSGAYVRLDNRTTAFAFNAGCLPIGTRVICSIYREARGNRLAVVVMESVLDRKEPGFGFSFDYNITTDLKGGVEITHENF